MEIDSEMAASVVITTRNRSAMALRAIASAVSQTVRAQIVVLDDASEDGTSEHVSAAFEDATLIRTEKPLGVIGARNLAFRYCQGEYIFTLDDDAIFRGDQVIEDAIGEFSHPAVGAVGLGLHNHFEDGTDVVADEPVGLRDFLCVAQFRGGANAIRRDALREIGGYSGTSRQGEERSFCLRLLDLGFVTRRTASSWVDHFPADYGDRAGRVLAYNFRNSLRYGIELLPFTDAVRHCIGTTATHFRAACRTRQFASYAAALAASPLDIVVSLRSRKPVSSEATAVFARLRQSGGLPFTEIQTVCANAGLRLRE